MPEKDMGNKKHSARVTERRSSPKDKLQLPEQQTRTHPSSAVGSPSPDKTILSEEDPFKKQAIEDLVTAAPENAPQVPLAELRKYHAGPKLKVADWIKVVVLKWWTGGMICYFFIWGLSTFLLNQWDHLFILGFAMGLVNNLITNNIFRFIARVPGAYDRWMMFPEKKLWFLPLDLIYATLLVFCTELTYNALNLLAAGPDQTVPVLGVEPILFGLIVTLWDLLFLGAKRLFQRILREAKEKAASGR